MPEPAILTAWLPSWGGHNGHEPTPGTILTPGILVPKQPLTKPDVPLGCHFGAAAQRVGRVSRDGNISFV